MHARGKTFNDIPCVNDDATWITALSEITQRHLSGWPTLGGVDAGALEAQRKAALAMGAKH